MMHYCTLFNKNYLANGLALYDSIEKFSKSDFKLYVLAMDDYTSRFLQLDQRSKMIVISLEVFENDELLSVKVGRSFGEYCWTCTPCLVRYCLDTYQIPFCIYLDADLFFFNDPNIGWNEMPNECSVLITEHNYHPKHDHRVTNGLYCVQYMGFRNNEDGNRVLNWWKDSCIEWCFAKAENNRFGDQKYLDDWLVRFPGVWVSQNKGIGFAPWNIEMFELENDSPDYTIINKVTKQKYKLVFYHFHGFRVYRNKIRLTEFVYRIDEDSKNKIYLPYIQQIIKYTDLDTLKNPGFEYYYVMYKKLLYKKVSEFFKLFTEDTQSPFNNFIPIKFQKLKND